MIIKCIKDLEAQNLETNVKEIIVAGSVLSIKSWEYIYSPPHNNHHRERKKTRMHTGTGFIHFSHNDKVIVVERINWKRCVTVVQKNNDVKNAVVIQP